MIRYPETFATVGRSDMIMAANSKIRPLDQIDFQSGESPLKAYKSWSVLNLNFANSEKKIGGDGAIEITHLADVKARTMIAMHHVMEYESNLPKETENQQASGSNLIDTKIFFLPKEINSDMRGKPAIEIARTSGSELARVAAKNLRNSAKNNPKYAGSNLKQAEALELAAIIVAAENYSFQIGDRTRTIKDLFAEDVNAAMQTCNIAYQNNPNSDSVLAAIDLLNAIKKDPDILSILKANTSESNTNTYKIYGPVFKTPNIRKVDKDGYTEAYSLAVWCDPKSHPYPFHLELKTMKGLPLQKYNVGIDSKTVTDVKSFTMELTTWEWLNIIERADWEAKLVAMWSHNEQYQAMLYSVEENRTSNFNH